MQICTKSSCVQSCARLRLSPSYS